MAQMTTQKPRVILSLAGYDPTAGAGVLLDCAVFRHFGFVAMGILTAVTAQNTQKVSSVSALPPKFLLLQYQTLRRDVSLSGLKVGLAGSRKNLPVIGRILDETKHIPVVLDPVFKASSGPWLFEKEAVSSYISQIRNKISVITPNLFEASLIVGRRIRNRNDMKEAARKIADLVAAPCLVKGGHLQEKTADLLYDGRNYVHLEKAKIKKDVHGTGCFLSSTLLCFLVEGYSLPKACELASAFTHAAIRKAIRIGKGRALLSPLL